MGKEYIFDLRITYLIRIRESVGSKIFRHCYCVDTEGDTIDVCQGGLFSCAVFVSNILKMHDLIKAPKANTGSLEKEMISCNWLLCKDKDRPYFGAVLFWEPKMGSDGEMHRHVGFYFGAGTAISNDPRSEEGGSTFVPIAHKMDCSDLLGYPREIEKVYFHALIG